MTKSKERMLNYITERGISNQCYINYISEQKSYENFRMIHLNGFDFAVSHFFDDSDTIGYGLISTNRILQTDKGRLISIGLIEGDDVICLDCHEGSVLIWMLQNGNGEHIRVADSFDDLWKELNNKTN